MNLQISQLEKDALEKNFNNQNFSLLEKDLCNFINKGHTQIWLYNLLAVSFAKQKKFKEAEVTFLKIIELEPNDFDHYFNLANLYKETKAYNKCIHTLKTALKIRPNELKAIVFLGLALFGINNFKDALDCANSILQKHPQSYEALNLKAMSLLKTGKFEEAIKVFYEIIEISDRKKEFLSHIAVCYIHLGDLENATKLINVNKNENNSKYNKSIIDLTLGNYQKGWEGFEYGLKNNSRKMRKGYENFLYLPDYDPALHSKTILLIGEQGIGDEIMYSTIIETLYTKVEKIYLLCDHRLIDLFKEKYSFLKFINYEYSKEIINIECKLAIGSLPKYFRNTEINFFNKNQSHNDQKSILRKSNSPKIIGLSWHTENSQFGPERNISLNSFASIIENKNLNFVNLQYGNHENAIKNLEDKIGRKVFLNDNIDNKNDIYGLAQKIKKCDAVLTIDNSTVHLSGFLNKTTFLMLPFVADWRWQLHRNDTPWYSSVKLFRQDKKNDWYSVIIKIKKIIENL